MTMFLILRYFLIILILNDDNINMFSVYENGIFFLKKQHNLASRRVLLEQRGQNFEIPTYGTYPRRLATLLIGQSAFAFRTIVRGERKRTNERLLSY